MPVNDMLLVVPTKGVVMIPNVDINDPNAVLFAIMLARLIGSEN